MLVHSLWVMAAMSNSPNATLFPIMQKTQEVPFENKSTLPSPSIVAISQARLNPFAMNTLCFFSKHLSWTWSCDSFTYRIKRRCEGFCVLQELGWVPLWSHWISFWIPASSGELWFHRYNPPHLYAPHVLFVENKAAHGGAIRLEMNTFGNFSGCNFIDNSAVGAGGAINLWIYAKASISNCSIQSTPYF